MSYLGIDIGGTHIRGVVVEETGEVLAKKEIMTEAQEGRESVLKRLFDLIGELLTADAVEAIGIGTPGPIDYMIGSVINSPNMPGFQNVPLKQLVSEKFKLPVALDRDANAALIGEHWIGEGKGFKNLAMLIWGTGVGGAIIIDNKIYRGHSDLAGEIGHMIIDEHGPKCNLGHNGCLESIIGGRQIELRYGRGLKEISIGARSGDPEDVQILDEIGEALKIGLKNIVTLFDPEIILLDGGCTKDLDLIMDKISDMPVRLSQFARVAGVMGAARLAMRVK